MSAIPPFSAGNFSASASGGASFSLSWNGARFLALVINALAGILGYFEREGSAALEPDSVFALRVLQGHLSEIHTAFEGLGFHPAILLAAKNLSLTAREIAARSAMAIDENFVSKDISRAMFGKEHFLGLPSHRRVNETLRWHAKDLLSRDSWHETSVWFAANGDKFFFDCITLLFDDQQMESEKFGECAKRILTEKGRIGFHITRQVFYVSVAKMMGRYTNLAQKLRGNLTTNLSLHDSAERIVEGYVDELCANVRDELARFRRDKKKLTRLPSSDYIDLIMEQVFVCLQFGYVDFAEPHILVTALAWQHPKLGCYTAQKPDSVPHIGVATDLEGNGGLAYDYYGGENDVATNEFQQSKKEDACQQHTSSVVAVAMVVFMRYILDPGPWPEFQFAEQLVQIDQIVAEDRFRNFRYLEWVRYSAWLHDGVHAAGVAQPLVHLYDGASAGDVAGHSPPFAFERHQSPHKVVPKPPPMTWSPDLIAFMILLFLFVGVSILVHHFLAGNRNVGAPKINGKRVYPYAFKKL